MSGVGSDAHLMPQRGKPAPTAGHLHKNEARCSAAKHPVTPDAQPVHRMCTARTPLHRSIRQFEPLQSHPRPLHPRQESLT